MTEEIVISASEGGHSCRTCRKWDGMCTDKRHRNADPDRPCHLYRYREQQAVVKQHDLKPGFMRCPKCRQVKYYTEFRSAAGKETVRCAACREKGQLEYAKRGGEDAGGMKRCKACNQAYPLSHFVSKDGLRETQTCRTCRKTKWKTLKED